jgi:peptidoglycan/xylan/chitin deacetylase (PgdA/CDA1 family)
VSEHTRRGFLALLAASTIAGVGAARYALPSSRGPVSSPPADIGPGIPVAPAAATAAPGSGSSAAPPAATRFPLPGGGVLSSLPGNADVMALTLDDGVNADVVRMYTQFAKDTGVRLTYFVNGTYPSWTENLELVRPLVESGQIQLGNHTWSHPDLTKIPASQVSEQISRNDRFLRSTYGVNAQPYLRPPYGNHNAAVRAVAADLGYPVTTLWNGSLSDSTVVTEDYIAAMADKYFNPRAIVIGHLNHLPVTHVYGKLIDVICARRLHTVTLKDVFDSGD